MVKLFPEQYHNSEQSKVEDGEKKESLFNDPRNLLKVFEEIAEKLEADLLKEMANFFGEEEQQAVLKSLEANARRVATSTFGESPGRVSLEEISSEHQQIARDAINEICIIINNLIPPYEERDINRTLRGGRIVRKKGDPLVTRLMDQHQILELSLKLLRAEISISQRSMLDVIDLSVGNDGHKVAKIHKRSSEVLFKPIDEALGLLSQVDPAIYRTTGM